MSLTDVFTERKRSYQLAFQSLDSTVMKDLAWFCRADASCVVPGDHDRTLILEGRREVYLRIKHHVEWTVEKLIETADPATFDENGKLVRIVIGGESNA